MSFHPKTMSLHVPQDDVVHVTVVAPCACQAWALGFQRCHAAVALAVLERKAERTRQRNTRQGDRVTRNKRNKPQYLNATGLVTQLWFCKDDLVPKLCRARAGVCRMPATHTSGRGREEKLLQHVCVCEVQEGTYDLRKPCAA